MDSLLGFKFNTCIPAQHLRCWTALIYLTTLMLHFCCWTRESMPAVITLLSFIRFVSYPFSITGCNTEISRLISTNTSPQHASGLALHVINQYGWILYPDYVTLPQSHPISYLSDSVYRYTGKNNSWRCNGLIGVQCVYVSQEEMRQSVAPAEPVQYYFTLAQQPGAVQVQGAQQGQQPAAQTAATIQPGQIIIAQPQQGQVRLAMCFVVHVARKHSEWNQLQKQIPQIPR